MRNGGPVRVLSIDLIRGEQHTTAQINRSGANEAKWRKHIQTENGKWVIYVRCDKANYGMVNAALLAYKKLAKPFTEWGCVMNPYYPCVWDKMIDGKRMSIMFHIDDLLLSFMEP